MKHVGDTQPVSLGKLPDSCEYMGQGMARDGAIHAVVIGRNSANCRKGIFSAGPELLTFGFVTGDSYLDGAGFLQNLFDCRNVFFYVQRFSVQLTQENRLVISRVT